MKNEMRSNSVCPSEMGRALSLLPTRPEDPGGRAHFTSLDAEVPLFSQSGTSYRFPHSGYFCSRTALPSPAPWGPSLHPTPRASQGCPRPLPSLVPPPGTVFLMHHQAGSFSPSHSGQHSQPWKTRPGEAGYQPKSFLVFVFQAYHYSSFQVEFRKSTCLARCPQPGMRAVTS